MSRSLLLLPEPIPGSNHPITRVEFRCMQKPPYMASINPFPVLR
jgi:hypothetical protein